MRERGRAGEEGVGQGDMTVRMACDRSLPHSRDSTQHLVIEPSSVLDLERHHNGAFAPRVGMRQRDCDAGNKSSEPDGVLHPGAYHAKKTHCERSLCGPTPGPTAARGHRQGHGLAWCTGTGSAATRQGAFDGMCAQAMVAPGGGAFPERQWRRRVAGAWDIGRVTSRHDRVILHASRVFPVSASPRVSDAWICFIFETYRHWRLVGLRRLVLLQF